VGPERLDELRHLDRVDVRVGGVVEGRAEQLGGELRLLHARMVHPHGIRGEEREEIQEPLPVAGIIEVHALALLEVEDEIETVREHALRDGLVDLVGRDGRGRRGQGRIHQRLLSGWVGPSQSILIRRCSLEVARTMSVRVWRTPRTVFSFSMRSLRNACMSRTRTLRSSENSPVMWWHSRTSSRSPTASMKLDSNFGCSMNISTNAVMSCPSFRSSRSAT